MHGKIIMVKIEKKRKEMNAGGCSSVTGGVVIKK